MVMVQNKRYWVGVVLGVLVVVFFLVLVFPSVPTPFLSFRTGESITLSSSIYNGETNDKFIGEARDRLDWWMELHEKLVKKARISTASIALYGDSITECWSGTQGNKEVDWCGVNRNVWERELQGRGNVEAFGMSGDQSKHLLWRLMHGEYVINAKKIAILIGTNDLGYTAFKAREKLDGSDSEVVQRAIEEEGYTYALKGMQLVVEYLMENKKQEQEIVMIGILPRGTRVDVAVSEEGKISEKRYLLPSEFTRSIERLNKYFATYATKHKKRGVRFYDCSEKFLTRDGSNVYLESRFMPDGLHPTGDGAEALAACLKEAFSLA